MWDRCIRRGEKCELFTVCPEGTRSVPESSILLAFRNFLHDHDWRNS